MQRLVTALALVGTLVPVALQAQAPPTPGPEHKKLAIWVGDWSVEGQMYATPLGPAGPVKGKGSAKPMFSGFFVEWRSEVTGPAGTTQWVEIDGYDQVAKKYFFNQYASDGGLMTGTSTIEGNTQSSSGTLVAGGKQATWRGTIVFAPDMMSAVEKNEASLDGKTWMPIWEGKWTKVRSSPK
jgi:hypothetical protein